MLFDCAVVGAGPAGGMAARTVSEKGFDVLLIDRKTEIGLPVRCAEGISHFALENSGLIPDRSWIKQEVKGSKVVPPAGKPYYYTDRGYSIDRHEFDKWIVKRATDAGCGLRLGTVAKEVSYDGRCWTLSTSSGEVKSRILIAADGPISGIAESLGMMIRRIWINAMQYKIDAKDFDYEENKWLCLYFSGRFKGGYGWVFPRKDEYNVGCGTFGEVRPLLKTFCKQLNLDCGKIKDTNAGVVPHEYDLSSLASKGLAIVGDSAGLTNPGSGGGIHPALVSGKMAGETACRALRLENPDIMLDYHKLLSQSDYTNPNFRKYANIFRRWGDEEFNLISAIMDGKDYKDLSKLRATKMFFKNPRFIKRVREFWVAYKTLRLVMKYGW